MQCKCNYVHRQSLYVARQQSVKHWTRSCAVVGEKSQRSVTHDSLRYINILTYLLTYLRV